MPEIDHHTYVDLLRESITSQQELKHSIDRLTTGLRTEKEVLMTLPSEMDRRQWNRIWVFAGFALILMLLQLGLGNLTMLAYVKYQEFPPMVFWTELGAMVGKITGSFVSAVGSIVVIVYRKKAGKALLEMAVGNDSQAK